MKVEVWVCGYVGGMLCTLAGRDADYIPLAINAEANPFSEIPPALAKSGTAAPRDVRKRMGVLSGLGRTPTQKAHEALQ